MRPIRAARPHPIPDASGGGISLRLNAHFNLIPIPSGVRPQAEGADSPLSPSAIPAKEAAPCA